MHPQMVLPLDTTPACSFDTFSVNDANQEAIASLRGFVTGNFDEKQIFLCGERGVGKSHLLNASCYAATSFGYRAAYLAGELLNDPSALDALEQFYLVCLDDLQRLDHAAEVHLYHCINRCRESGTRLLLSADRAPVALGLELPDLLTRLSWGPVYHLPSLTDADLRLALVHEFQRRSLTVSPDVIDYLLRRVSRNLQDLKSLAGELDQASLSAQRRVTIPLVRLVLADHGEAGS